MDYTNKKILFDFDGTIVHSEQLVIELYNELAAGKEYKKIAVEDVEQLRSYSLIEKCKMIGIPVYKIPKMFVEAKKIYKNHVSSLVLKDGVFDLLYNLKNKGFRLDILSSNDEDVISEFVKSRNIDLFDHIYSSNNLFGKHHAIKRYLKKHDLSEDDIWYIGDEVRDIVSCKKANVKVIAVAWGYDSEQILAKEKPDYLVREPHELLDIVCSSKAV
jgi:phosphoglycolate phosphatase